MAGNGRAAGGLADIKREERDAVGKGRGQRITDMPGDQLGRRVDHIERRNLVEVLVDERRDDRIERALDGVEVTEQTLIVEFIAADRGADPPVVAVTGSRSPLMTIACAAGNSRSTLSS